VTRWILLASIAFATAVLPVSRVTAQMLKCKFNYTDTHDHERLRTAIQKVLPADVAVESLPTVCRNPRSALAWLSTAPRLRTDGATEWWAVQCKRETAEWACEVPLHRQLIWVYVEMKGLLRRVEVSFDEAIGLTRARAAAARTTEIIQDNAARAPAACEGPADAENQRRWEEYRKEFWAQARDAAPELSVESADKDVVDVITNGGAGPLGLEFREATDGSIGPVCWVQWVVVT